VLLTPIQAKPSPCTTAALVGGGTHWLVLRTAGGTQVGTTAHFPLTTALPAPQSTLLTVSVVLAEVGPKLPMRGWEAVIVVSPGPLMVTRVPAMVATAVLLLVNVKAAGLREEGGVMSKAGSVSYLLMAANGPSGGPWSGSLHADIRNIIKSKPTIRFIIPPHGQIERLAQ
jgi:hypothetical protein